MSHTVYLRDRQFTVQEGQTILDAALDQNIDFPHSCQVGSCSTCRCRLVKGDIRAFIEFDYVLMPDEIEAGWILACQSSPKTDLEISFVD